ncbi:MAG: bacillithiol biosynthesis deacetylase BshB2 [Bacilli bacterium]
MDQQFKERHVLVVFPHPDDETFGCGGTIALFTKAGVPVTYACGTLGEMGRNMGRPPFATRESLARIREAELDGACAALGIRRLIKLGLRDKTIEFEDQAVLVDRIERTIRDIRPSLMITHYPGYAVHPDHNALGEAAIRAAARLSKEERPVVYAHALSQDALSPPDIVRDISSVREVKVAAIRAHRSQSGIAFATLEDGDGPLNDPAMNARIRTLLEREVFWTYPMSMPR